MERKKIMEEFNYSEVKSAIKIAQEMEMQV